MMKDASPKYHLDLNPQDFGDKAPDVFATLKRTVPGLRWSFEHFNQKPEGNHPIHGWRYLTGQQSAEIIAQFVAVDVQLEVESIDATFLFPADQLDGFTNDWYSGQLIGLGEDALCDWAEAEKITETYRFTLLPSFEPPITVRAWADGIVYKKGSAMGGVMPGPVSKVESWIPSQNSWYHLRHMLKRYRFWTAPSWYTVPEGYGVMDGEILLFEGYKNGQSKFLYDHSPDDGAAYTLRENFLNLKPDNS